MRRTVPALVAALLVVALLPGTAAAAQAQTGGTVVVGPDETHEGDLEAFAGSVVVEGTVTGDLEAAAGNVEITGTVEGDVEAAGGSVTVGEGARIGGSLSAGAGPVVVDGRVDGDAEIGAEEIRIGPNADIRGDLTYDGQLGRADGATVGGTVAPSDDVQVNPGGPTFSVPTGTFTVYGVLANLVAGAVLLVAFPRFSTTVADGIDADPLRTGAFGLLALLAVPIVCTLLLRTLVDIPLSLAGFVGYVFLVWAGALYGRFALGRWLLAQADRDSRWLALLVGVVGAALVKLIPILGDLVEAAVVLVGLGALVLALRDRYRSEGDEDEPEVGPQSPAGDAEPA
jgi:cytoskeletal protein CcmA (bactofilin family)